MKELNISFTKLGEEECESCLCYGKHEHDNPLQCTICKDWRIHNEKAMKSRREYQKDVTTDHTEDEAYFAPGVKTSVFTRRLVVFHETFAPLGGGKKKPVGVVWHEGIAGRNAEDVMSSYHKAMNSTHCRDVNNFIFWADNCTAQNKNWTLYTGLVSMVNSEAGPRTVTIKYFEKGHTFMAADSFHAQVEKGLRKKNNV